MTKRDNDLIGVYKAIDRMEAKWKYTESPKTNDKGTILGLWKVIRQMHYFLQNEYKELQKTYREKSEKWNEQYSAKQARLFQEEFSRNAKRVGDALKEDIRNFVITKTEKIDKMISTAPSEDELRLLQAIQMRGNNISRAEIMRIMPSLYSNYNSMKILQNIGRSVNCVVHLPQNADAIEMLETLDSAGQYFTRMTDEAVNPGKPSLMARPFFYIDENDQDKCIDGAVNTFSEVLDYVPQINDFNVDYITATDRARLQILFKEADALDEHNAGDQIKISEITRKVLQDNPDDVNLIMKSEYARYAKTLISVKGPDATQVEVSNRDHEEDISERISGEVGKRISGNTKSVFES